MLPSAAVYLSTLDISEGKGEYSQVWDQEIELYRDETVSEVAWSLFSRPGFINGLQKHQVRQGERLDKVLTLGHVKGLYFFIVL